MRIAKGRGVVDIVVADTGQGISAEFLPYVFDRFRQADASPSRRHGGLGLGLALARQIIELHGGSISVKSAGTGQRRRVFGAAAGGRRVGAGARRAALGRDRL